MRHLLLIPALCLCIAARAQSPALSPALSPTRMPEEAAIRATLDTQSAAWNRADLDAFMQTYERSPETTFIGTAVRKGWQPILDRFKKAYTTKEQMGALSFSDLEVHLLPSSCGAAELALVTGRFHLARSEHGEAAKDEGVFSLVLRKGAEGWKIILDHTS